MLLRRVVGIWHGALGRGILRSPLRRTRRTLHLLPLVAEQDSEVVVVPLHRVGRPCALQPARDRGATAAGAIGVRPAEALRLEGSRLRVGADVLARIGRTVRLAERVSAGNERNRL